MLVTSDYDSKQLDEVSGHSDQFWEYFDQTVPTMNQTNSSCSPEPVLRDQGPVLATYGVLLFIGGLGNLAVLVALARLRRRRSRVDLLMTHLALADVCVTCGVIPLEMLVPLLLLGVFGVICWKVFLSSDENPLDVLPGPPGLPVIGNTVMLMNVKPRDLFTRVLAFTKQYGDRYIFKILKMRVLHISNPVDVEIVLSHSRNLTKSLPYTFLESWLGTGLLLSTGSKWHRRRKILTPTFHFNILKNFAVVMEEKSRDLIGRLKALDGARVDVLPVVSDFTLFTICETAMGTQLDSDKSAATIEYKKAVLEIGLVLLNRVTKIWLHNEFVFRSLPVGKQFEKYLSTVQSFADNVIIDKKKKRTINDENDVKSALVGEDFGSKKRLAMLDLLLEAESKGEIDVEGIKEEVNTFMFEGHDTTAMAITFCLMLLADHDDVQERILAECTQVLSDSDRTPNTSDLAEMKYLEAVIKETLRLYPSVPFIGREITEDFMMGDLLVKKGTEISVHIYDIHHREDLYPDPEAFKPDRFLSGETRHPYAYVPFSAGPRNCIGQRFAMQEMKCVVAEICRHFKLVPLKKGVRPTLATDMVLRPAEPIYVKFLSR